MLLDLSINISTLLICAHPFYFPSHLNITPIKLSPDAPQIAQYAKTYFSAGRLALVGVGVCHEELEELAANFEPCGAAGVPAEKAFYHSGAFTFSMC